MPMSLLRHRYSIETLTSSDGAEDDGKSDEDYTQPFPQRASKVMSTLTV